MNWKVELLLFLLAYTGVLLLLANNCCLIQANKDLTHDYQTQKELNKEILKHSKEVLTNADPSRYDERCIMWDLDEAKGLRPSSANGIAFSDGYYAVWTKDRSLTEIERTDYHEECHILVWDNFTHFCEEPFR